MFRRYRCDDCAGTSGLCFTDGSLLREARRHRILAHDGLIPDGERVIDVPIAKLVDVPRGQVIATAMLFLVLVVAVAVRG
ncbi:hypothetical protein ACFU93_32415 [Streptomyces sp. NPDC057611]|uniref:hypothetical protein n=1 Tax=Streptomyces sp. NPDC057611 TaxID=3346182 RepID=UPI0036C0F962